jgi:hypothetical protein
MTATAVVEPLVITEPGLYEAIPAEDYHRDPVPGGSLSSTGARALLPPGCPAKFAYEREHGGPEKPEFDFGHAAHREVLGDGEVIVIIEADSFRTKKAQEQRDAAYAAGKTPLLRHKYDDIVVPMAKAIREHPVAGKLLAPGVGLIEASLFWVDGVGQDAVMCRARPDLLRPEATVTGGLRRALGVDYKTCTAGSIEDLVKANGRHRLFQQAQWYLTGITSVLRPILPPAFVFVFQEKTPPYVVTVCQLDQETAKRGEARNRRALEVYRRCRTSGRWPGYSDKVVELGLPGWLINQLDEEEYSDER